MTATAAAPGAADVEEVAPSLFSTIATPGEQLVVGLEGFEGPLDLLLALARAQKVDLGQLSMAALAEQYLAFLEREGALMHMESAAAYLVMAARLAWMKSRLLLPAPPDDDEPDAFAMADMLAFRLHKLEAMREAAGALMGRALVGRDVFARGAPEGDVVVERVEWRASQGALIAAYAAAVRRRRARTGRWRPVRLAVMPVAVARRRLEALGGRIAGWCALDACLPEGDSGAEGGSGGEGEAALRRSALASTLCAALEMVRERRLDIRQAGAFAPVEIRAVAAEQPVRIGRAGGGE